MSRLHAHPENHLVDRIGWLRAAVLGANDGIISTASLIVGVAAAAATRNDVLIAGIAGLVAGAMSMAAGEYVSVSSQSDTEQADLARERKELSENPAFELDELAEIYVKRGVDKPLARQVAEQLMAKDALTAHARDELGISEITAARPIQAALTSAAMFSVGAAMPLLMVIVSPGNALVPVVSAASLAFLARSGSDRGKGGRREHSASHYPCDVLGRFCLGAHRRYWKAVRDGGLKFRLGQHRARNLVWLRSGSRPFVRSFEMLAGFFVRTLLVLLPAFGLALGFALPLLGQSAWQDPCLDGVHDSGSDRPCLRHCCKPATR